MVERLGWAGRRGWIDFLDRRRDGVSEDGDEWKWRRDDGRATA